MTVEELIAQLQHFPKDAFVIMYCDWSGYITEVRLEKDNEGQFIVVLDQETSGKR